MKTLRAALTACVLATLTAWPGAPHAQANRSAALPPDPATVIVTPAGAVGVPVEGATPPVASVATPTSVVVTDPGLLDQSLDYYAFIEGAPADPVLMAKDPNAGVSATLSLDGVHCGQNRIDVYYDYSVINFRRNTTTDRQTYYGFLFVACPTISLSPAISFGADSKTITVLNSGFDPAGDDQLKTLRFDGVQVASPTYSRLPRPVTFTTQASCGHHTVDLSQPWAPEALTTQAPVDLLLEASAVYTVLCPALALTPSTIMKSAAPAPVGLVMNLNSHPHPYGIVIAGNDLGTDQQSYLYCAAYGNGNFIVRGFGPAPFQMNGPRGSADPAVNKAAGVGEPVTQEIAISVKGGKVECAINNKVVASYDKSALVTAGKLKSTDGVYGIRFAHNTEALVTGLKITKP